jgi:hypothetical protein
MKVKRDRSAVVGMFPTPQTTGVITLSKIAMWLDVDLVPDDSTKLSIAFLGTNSVAYNGVAIEKFQDWGKFIDGISLVLKENGLQTIVNKRRNENNKI